MSAEQLFDEINMMHTFGNTVTTTTNKEVDERAKNQYLSRNGKLPNLEDIDCVINEYRKSKNNG